MSQISEFIKQNELVQAEKFSLIIKQVCKLASVKFLKAVTHIGYMEPFYSESHYENLDKAIEVTCKDLTLKVFGEKKAMDEKEWLQNLDKSEFVWLNSFVAIREKIHQTANLEMYHINESESERALNRLIRQQEKV